MGKHTPPKDGLVRAARPGLELRAAADSGKMPTLTGYFIRFNEATEIDSLFEGRFIERIAPGAAKKTLKENRDSIKILYNHGHDPSIGEKPLAKPTLEEDEEGVRYEGELFDTSYNRDLVPALEAGQLGASFKFRVVKETFDEEPDPSDENPEGLPERTIEELKLYEGGPVTFPAYEGSSAGVRSRSLTDRMFVERAKVDPGKVPELVELFTEWVRADPDRVRDLIGEDAPAEPEADTDTSTDARADESHSDDAPAAGEQPEESNEDVARDADEHSDDDARSNGAGSDHSVATTQESEDTGWWRSLSDDDSKEWRLP